MALQTIGQQRANKALEWVKEPNRTIGKELKGAAEGFGPLILMSGLGQAAAFYKSKDAAHQALYQLLSDWLCGTGRPFGTGTGDLLERLVVADQSHYRAAQAEALAFLQWVKKFVKAYGEN
jgi:CRISPR-associated protein Cmr5